MSHVGEVWIADLVRAIVRLKPRDERSKAAVAGLLAFNWCGHKLVPSAPLAPAARSSARKPVNQSQEEHLPARPQRSKPPTTPSTEKSDALGELLTPLSETSDQSESLSRPWEAQTPLDEVGEQHLAKDFPSEPLFERQWTREILAGVAATSAAVGELDTERAVATVAQGRPIQKVPRLRRRSLARGVQLLVDLGTGMEPFRRDQQQLAEALRAVVGESLVEELSFHECPGRGCCETSSWEEVPYRLPPPGTPVAVLSDMGIRRPRLHHTRCSIEEWTELAKRISRQRCPLIALVPYPEDRWRRLLTSVIVHISWDRSTTISRVLERLR